MTEDRRKEIALRIVEAEILERGLPGGNRLRQDLGNQVKKLEGVTLDELMAFYETFVPKLYGKVFSYRSVAINAGNATSHVNEDNT